MVSRRNYAAITMMFVILFFMFQFSGIMKEQLNEYEKNAYVETTGTTFTAEDCFVPEEDGAQIILVGEENDVAEVVRAFCTYSKRDLLWLETFNIPEAETLSGKIFMIDGLCLKTEEEVTLLRTLVEQGNDLIFARMPEFSFIADCEPLRDLLGIYQAYTPEIRLNGMHLFSGFLLGGEALYEVQSAEDVGRQDLAIGVPWYVTSAGTKTYMVGTLTQESYDGAVENGLAEAYVRAGTDEESTKNSVLPAILWRKSFDTAKVFCVNADFLTQQTGIGILSAFMAERSTYELYPVVNAQNLVVAGYPSFSEENAETIEKYYSQSPTAVYQDIVWPSLVSVANRIGAKLSCMLTPRFDYERSTELFGDQVSFYLKLFGEEDVEAGLLAAAENGATAGEKLEQDAGFFAEYAGEYQFLSAATETAEMLAGAAEALPGTVRTVAVGDTEGKQPLLSYSGDLTLQYATGNGVSHTFREDFMLRSVETALGYSTVVLDLRCVTYPESEEDSWHTLSKKIAANLVTYWKPYDVFQETTLSQSDDRVRRFLALDYRAERNGDIITLETQRFDTEAYFILRTDNERVRDIEGGSATEAEEGIWLIGVEEPSARILLEKEEKW